MAYMSLMKNLDEKAKKKDLDGVFQKLDKNQNGKIFTTDFVNELNDQGYEMSEDEKSKLLGISDNKGQLSKAAFNEYYKNSSMFKKSGDKNRNLPVLSNTDRHEVAFKALDSNNDGYVSKAEFSKLMKNLSMDQVNTVIGKFDNDNDGLLDLEEFRMLMNKNQKKKEKFGT